ncbi:IS66 family transposase zinc-finger binding domain-containing protein [Mesorhizobium sp. M0228]|uniref:IS66 family transposase zinc-finger binding domain-containing protein n=1 Tax=Mesorhizobium sp. M0228 TaxID=2956923 RepID=UPI00333E066F
MELQLEELERAASEDDLAAGERRPQPGGAHLRAQAAVGQPIPDHLRRERIVIAAPESCPCCGSPMLLELGEDVTETLELIPQRPTVIQTGVSSSH